MPNSLASLLSAPTFTAVNENTGTQVWSALGIAAVEIDSSSENTDAPLSNMQQSQTSVYQDVTQADIESVKIMLPTRLRVVALCDDLSTLENVIATWADVTITISVTTKSIITTTLCLAELEIEQSPEMISAVKLTMIFEQAQPPQNSGFAPAQAGDQSVYGISISSPLSVTPLATLTQAVSAATFVATPPVSDALIDNKGNPFILDSSKLS